jgi:hypothetical protein
MASQLNSYLIEFKINTVLQTNHALTFRLHQLSYGLDNSSYHMKTLTQSEDAVDIPRKKEGFQGQKAVVIPRKIIAAQVSIV